MLGQIVQSLLKRHYDASLGKPTTIPCPDKVEAAKVPSNAVQGDSEEALTIITISDVTQPSGDVKIPKT